MCEAFMTAFVQNDALMKVTQCLWCSLIFWPVVHLHSIHTYIAMNESYLQAFATTLLQNAALVEVTQSLRHVCGVQLVEHVHIILCQLPYHTLPRI